MPNPYSITLRRGDGDSATPLQKICMDGTGRWVDTAGDSRHGEKENATGQSESAIYVEESSEDNTSGISHKHYRRYRNGSGIPAPSSRHHRTPNPNASYRGSKSLSPSRFRESKIPRSTDRSHGRWNSAISSSPKQAGGAGEWGVVMMDKSFKYAREKGERPQNSLAVRTDLSVDYSVGGRVITPLKHEISDQKLDRGIDEVAALETELDNRSVNSNEGDRVVAPQRHEISDQKLDGGMEEVAASRTEFAIGPANSYDGDRVVASQRHGICDHHKPDGDMEVAALRRELAKMKRRLKKAEEKREEKESSYDSIIRKLILKQEETESEFKASHAKECQRLKTVHRRTLKKEVGEMKMTYEETISDLKVSHGEECNRLKRLLKKTEKKGLKEVSLSFG